MSRGLVEKLRSRIKDERYKTPAFSIGIGDTTTTSAILEIDPRRFILTTTGGDVPNIDFDLSDDRYNTVGRLGKALDAISGVTISFAEDIEFDHPSDDLQPLPATELVGKTYQVTHRLFSDSELISFVDEAAQRHNPGYDAGNIPFEEESLVLTLAQAGVVRHQAIDAAKRRGMAEDVGTLLDLARSIEEVYDKDSERLRRVIPSPTLTQSQQNLMREGDVVIGQLVRRSPRNGYMTPMAASLPPDAAVLLEPRPGDVEDINARIRWQRNTEQDFYSYELWRDTQPDVQRSRQVVLFMERDIDPSDLNKSKFDRPTTSKLVFRSFGPNSTRENRAFSAFIESFGQLVTSVIDRDYRTSDNKYGLEPETEYFYRLYVVNVNGDAFASNILRIKTLPLRAKFAETNPIVPTSGVAGTVVTINCTNLSEDCRVSIGGKQLINQVVTPGPVGTIVGVLPVFHTTTAKDVVLESPSGLFEIKMAAFTVLDGLPAPLLYWGKGLVGLSTESDIKALAHYLSSSERTLTFTESPGVNEYIYYASPVDYGVPTFMVGCFEGGFDLVATVSVTDAYGVARDYGLWRSHNANLGTTTVQVV